MFLSGAKPETIAREVVCAGVELPGKPMVVPTTMLPLLLERLYVLDYGSLTAFMSYRANAEFNRHMLLRRPHLMSRLTHFITPIAEDSDVELFIVLFRHGLVTEEQRLEFVETLERGLRRSADASFVTDDGIRSLLSTSEIEHLLKVGADEVLGKLKGHTERLRGEWNSEYSPDSYFEQFSDDVTRLADSCKDWIDPTRIKLQVRDLIEQACDQMRDLYEPPVENSETVVQKSESAATPLDDIFRDIDD